jgi:hypothetical protein
VCADWVRTQGNRVHSIFAQLTDANGGLDIPPGTIVQLFGRRWDEAAFSIGGVGLAVSPGAEPNDSQRGFVKYDLSTADMERPGMYYCKWRLYPPGSSEYQSFPEDDPMILLIQSDP